jgi:hypothetical protein
MLPCCLHSSWLALLMALLHSSRQGRVGRSSSAQEEHQRASCSSKRGTWQRAMLIQKAPCKRRRGGCTQQEGVLSQQASSPRRSRRQLPCTQLARSCCSSRWPVLAKHCSSSSSRRAATVSAACLTASWRWHLRVPQRHRLGSSSSQRCMLSLAVQARQHSSSMQMVELLLAHPWRCPQAARSSVLPAPSRVRHRMGSRQALRLQQVHQPPLSHSRRWAAP